MLKAAEYLAGSDVLVTAPHWGTFSDKAPYDPTNANADEMNPILEPDKWKVQHVKKEKLETWYSWAIRLKRCHVSNVSNVPFL